MFHVLFEQYIKKELNDNTSNNNNTRLEIQIFRGGVFHGSLSFARSEYSSNVLENMPLNSVILTVITNRYFFCNVINIVINCVIKNIREYGPEFCHLHRHHQQVLVSQY